MTKIAVISDIHANKIALDLALEDMEKRGVDKIVCLGDLVTKYTEPSLVVDAIRSNCDIVIKGNCDNHVATNENYRFARGKLGMSRIEYLSSLPEKAQLYIGGLLVNFFHASPNSLEEMFNPLFSNEKTKYNKHMITDYRQMFTGQKGNEITFYGHTHQKYIGIAQNDLLGIVDRIDQIIPVGQKIIVNTGSIGDPVFVADAWRNDPFLIDSKISYALIEGKLEESISNVRISLIEIPYHEKLKMVYNDLVTKQEQGLYPSSPKDTQRVLESLTEQEKIASLESAKGVRK